MSTLAEIETALFALPRAEQETLRRKLDRRLAESASSVPRSWPVLPPQVDRAELEWIDAEIEAVFPTLRG